MNESAAFWREHDAKYPPLKPRVPPTYAAGHPFVQTDGKVGLTEADADRVIAMLKGG